MCVYPSCLHPPTMEAWQCLFQTGCYWKTDACRDCSGLTPGMLKSFQADQLDWKTSLAMGWGWMGEGGSSTPLDSFPSSASGHHPPPLLTYMHILRGCFQIYKMVYSEGAWEALFPPSRPSSPPAHPGFSHPCLSKILPIRRGCLLSIILFRSSSPLS